jgi:Histidine phosphatase superfamily (branch 2)
MNPNIPTFLLTMLLASSVLTVINPKYEPVMVSALWRHGARNARLNIFKATVDPLLTDPQDVIGNGARMHYILGQ